MTPDNSGLTSPMTLMMRKSCDINQTLLISVLEVAKLPKELQIMIASYVDFTAADCYTDFYAFATNISQTSGFCEDLELAWAHENRLEQRVRGEHTDLHTARRTEKHHHRYVY